MFTPSSGIIGLFLFFAEDGIWGYKYFNLELNFNALNVKGLY